MHVRLCQLDGSLPNYALLRLAHWHRERGDVCRLYRGERAVSRHLDEPEYGRVYASAIFGMSAPLVERFRWAWPEAIVGGTGTDSGATLADILGEEPTGCDYSLWPQFTASIGYTHRGCNLKCKWCIVPKMEPGGARSVASISDLWRGGGHPRNLHLLDNSFFAQPEWRERIAEIRDGKFKVCFSQGLNVRDMTLETAAAVASVNYQSTDFDRRRLYTAWDNLADEAMFFRGVELLRDAGVPPAHLLVYMLTGFDKAETLDRIERRFWRMADLGMRPYPMVYVAPGTGQTRNGLPLATLKRFQRWAILGRYHGCTFADFDESKRVRRKHPREDDSADLFTT